MPYNSTPDHKKNSLLDLSNEILINIFEFVAASVRIIPAAESADAFDLESVNSVYRKPETQELSFHELLALRSVCRKIQTTLQFWYDCGSQLSGDFKSGRGTDCLCL